LRARLGGEKTGSAGGSGRGDEGSKPAKDPKRRRSPQRLSPLFGRNHSSLLPSRVSRPGVSDNLGKLRYFRFTQLLWSQYSDPTGNTSETRLIAGSTICATPAFVFDSRVRLPLSKRHAEPAIANNTASAGKKRKGLLGATIFKNGTLAPVKPLQEDI